MNLYKQLITHALFSQRSSEYLRWYPKSLSVVNENEFPKEIEHLQGIYIHVPFCDKLCSFCPFNKRISNVDDQESYLLALIKEIELYASITKSSAIDFIYFGGGTPSALKTKSIHKILNAIHRFFSIEPEVEITLESHPTHLTLDNLNEFKRIGISRISSGIQSFDDQMLKKMGAQHTKTDSFNAIRNTNDVFGSIAIDILYRCEGQDLSQLKNELNVIESNKHIDHVSAYSLFLKNDEAQPSKLIEAEMTALVHESLEELGFKHYASCASGGFDFAKKGKESKYEYFHWRAPQHTFLGLGPGAFGFTGTQNTVNGLTLRHYTSSLKANQFPAVSITNISEKELMHRYFSLGVKTLSINFDSFFKKFNQSPREVFSEEFNWLKENNFAIIDEHGLKLTKIGSLFVDEINYAFNSKEQKIVKHPEEPEIRNLEKHNYIVN